LSAENLASIEVLAAHFGVEIAAAAADVVEVSDPAVAPSEQTATCLPGCIASSNSASRTDLLAARYRHNDCTEFVGYAECPSTGAPCMISDDCRFE